MNSKYIERFRRSSSGRVRSLAPTDYADFFVIQLKNEYDSKSLKIALGALNKKFGRRNCKDEFWVALKSKDRTSLLILLREAVQVWWLWCFMMWFKEVLDTSGVREKFIEAFYPYPPHNIYLPDTYVNRTSSVSLDPQAEYGLKIEGDRITLDIDYVDFGLNDWVENQVLAISGSGFKSKVNGLNLIAKQHIRFSDNVIERYEQANKKNNKPTMKNVKVHCRGLAELFEKESCHRHRERLFMACTAIHCVDGEQAIEDVVKNNKHWDWTKTFKQIEQIKRKNNGKGYNAPLCSTLQEEGVCVKNKHPKFNNICFVKNPNGEDAQKNPGPLDFAKVAPNACWGYNDL